MERLVKKNLTHAQKMARLSFSIKLHSLDWSKIVFMGLNKIGDLEMCGVIGQHVECSLHVVVGSVTSHKYVSFLDNVILPMWNSNQSLIFMQDKKQSNLSRAWRNMHHEVAFLYWPNIMGDQNPFNDVWANVNNRIKYGFHDLAAAYVSWNDTRDDFDNFRHVYDGMQNRLQKIEDNSGNYTSLSSSAYFKTIVQNKFKKCSNLGHRLNKRKLNKNKTRKIICRQDPNRAIRKLRDASEDEAISQYLQFHHLTIEDSNTTQEIKNENEVEMK